MTFCWHLRCLCDNTLRSRRISPLRSDDVLSFSITIAVGCVLRQVGYDTFASLHSWLCSWRDRASHTVIGIITTSGAFPTTFTRCDLPICNSVFETFDWFPGTLSSTSLDFIDGSRRLRSWSDSSISTSKHFSFTTSGFAFSHLLRGHFISCLPRPCKTCKETSFSKELFFLLCLPSGFVDGLSSTRSRLLWHWSRETASLLVELKIFVLPGLESSLCV